MLKIPLAELNEFLDQQYPGRFREACIKSEKVILTTLESCAEHVV